MKTYVRVAILIMLCIFAMSFSLSVYASGWADDIYEEQKNNSEGDDPSGASEKINDMMGSAAVVVKIVAVATAVIILIVLGMKYMIAAPGDKADIKKSMIPFVIGAFVVFAAVGLIKMIIMFSSNLGGE